MEYAIQSSAVSKAAPKQRTVTFRFILIVGLATILVTLFALAIGNSFGTQTERLRTPPLVLIIHLMTVIPAVPLGIYVFFTPKGTLRHKMAGRVWAMLMIITAIDSFWIKSSNGSIGPIHVFSVISLVSITRAMIAIRRGDIATHERAMMGSFIGLLVAGVFSFLPGRIMGSLVFG